MGSQDNATRAQSSVWVGSAFFLAPCPALGCAPGAVTFSNSSRELFLAGPPEPRTPLRPLLACALAATRLGRSLYE